MARAVRLNNPDGARRVSDRLRQLRLPSIPCRLFGCTNQAPAAFSPCVAGTRTQGPSEFQTVPNLFDDLTRYAELDDEHERRQIDEEIWGRYGKEQAVFVLDMAGFSRVAAARGVVHYLSMIQRMRTTIGPVIHKNGGVIVKYLADNCFARFAHVSDAISAAQDGVCASKGPAWGRRIWMRLPRRGA